MSVSVPAKTASALSTLPATPVGMQLHATAGTWVNTTRPALAASVARRSRSSFMGVRRAPPAAWLHLRWHETHVKGGS